MKIATFRQQMLDASEKQVDDWKTFAWFSTSVTSQGLFNILNSGHGCKGMSDYTEDLPEDEVRIALALIATAPTNALKESFEGLQ